MNNQMLCFVAKFLLQSHKKITIVSKSFLLPLCLRAATTLTRDQLNSLNSSVSQLRSSLDLLQANVTAVTNRINKTLSNPACLGCDKLHPELQNLRLDTTISVSSDFNWTCHVNQLNL